MDRGVARARKSGAAHRADGQGGRRPESDPAIGPDERRMRRAIFLLVALAINLVALQAAPKETAADVGGIQINPNEGEIAPGDEITITFPAPMVNPDKIDMEKQPCPFVSQPPIEGDFLWKSQTEGVLTVTGIVAGAKHRLALARDLKDASGKRVQAPGWSAELSARPFTISSDFSEKEQLTAQPQIELNSTYDVRLGDVAEHVYFQ